MKHLALPLALASGAALAGHELATAYRAGAAVLVEHETTVVMETTAMEIERDGEVIDRPLDGNPTTTVRSASWVDTVLEVEDGAPAKVRRSFDEVGGSASGTRREESFEQTIETPWGGVTLELTRDGDDVEVDVVEGDEPDHEDALEGHLLALPLDALLPGEEVEVDDTWELEADDVRRAIGADVRAALFPPPPRPEGGRGGGPGGGGGGRRGGGGTGAGNFLGLAEWTGEATLTAVETDEDGLEVAVVELELEAEGELPERERGGFGGGGGGGNAAGLLPPGLPLATEFEVELEGTLVFDVEARRPLRLELEGEVTILSETERETPNGGTFRMSREQSGTLTITTTVTEAEAEPASDAR